MKPFSFLLLSLFWLLPCLTAAVEQEEVDLIRQELANLENRIDGITGKPGTSPLPNVSRVSLGGDEEATGEEHVSRFGTRGEQIQVRQTLLVDQLSVHVKKLLYPDEDIFFRFALYSDLNGQPRQRIFQTDKISIKAAGKIEYRVTPFRLAPNTYWLMTDTNSPMILGHGFGPKRRPVRTTTVATDETKPLSQSLESWESIVSESNSVGPFQVSMHGTYLQD